MKTKYPPLIWKHRHKIQDLKIKFVSWFHAHFPGKYCWADCVNWAFSLNRWNPFKIDTSLGCEIESKEHQHKACYCGSWHNGVCFDKLSKVEQEKIRHERKRESEKHKDEMPF